jgi:hypothetical protein
MPVDEAERLLRCTKIFAVGGMPDKKPVQAFNVLFEEPDATTRFRTLAVQGQTAGRLYALAALLLLDPTEGNRAAQELSRQSDTVTVQDSDVEYRRRKSRDAIVTRVPQVSDTRSWTHRTSWVKSDTRIAASRLTCFWPWRSASGLGRTTCLRQRQR